MRTLSPILGLLLATIVLLNQNHAAFFKITNAVCESLNKSWIEIEYCRIKAVHRNKTTLNIVINYLHPTNNIDLRLQVMKKANGYKPWLMDYKVDFCEFVRKKNHPGVKLIFGFFQNFTNFNHTCPYKGVIILKDFFLDPTRIMLPWPTGDYLLIMTYTFDKKPQYMIRTYFTFVEDFNRKYIAK